MSSRRLRLLFAVLTGWGACAPHAAAARDELHVGPQQTYATPDRVPWDSLEAGDRVFIHWRAQAYRSKWVLCCRGTADAPITISGVPGPEGELPVLDAERAVSPISVEYLSGERGVIKIGGAAFAPELMPGHIVIENLEIRGARPGRFFVSRQGILQYSDAASSIYVEKGDHITIRNCILHDCANGFFTAHETAEILLESCHVFDNGLEDSVYQHNAYTESAGMVYQFNRFGPLRTGCSGNNIKDRSAGLVVHCNWIEGGNRQLDLVDAEDSELIQQDPRYDTAYVYGNILIEPDGAGNNQIVHYGGDNGPEETFRHGPLYFYNNTLVSLRAGTTALFRLSTNDVTARAFNNILFVAAPGDHLSILDETGIVHLSQNFLKPGWHGSHGELTGVIRAEANLEAEDPGFVDLSRLDVRLRPGSLAIDRGAGEPPPRHPLEFEFDGARGMRARARHGPLDLGAFEH